MSRNLIDMQGHLLGFPLAHLTSQREAKGMTAVCRRPVSLVPTDVWSTHRFGLYATWPCAHWLKGPCRYDGQDSNDGEGTQEGSL
jgi:hypothetical protein